MKKLSVAVVLMLIASLALTACNSGTPATQQPSGQKVAKDILRIRHASRDLTSFDPAKANDGSVFTLNGNLYDRLVELDSDATIVPGLAEKWETADQKVWTFTLRKGVKFHNGDELKADDVVFSLTRAKDDKMKDNKVFSIQGVMEKIEKIDDYTVKITTKAPFGQLLNHLAHTSGSIVNKKVVEAEGENYGKAKGGKVVGTGAYKLVSNDDQKLVMEKFDGYYGGAKNVKPTIKTLEFVKILDEQAAVMALEAGDIDVMQTVPASSIDLVKKNANLKFEERPSLGFSYIAMNHKDKALSDVKVRKALTLLTDVKEIIDVQLNGSGTIAVSPLSKQMVDTGIKPLEKNIDEAKKLLKEAGYEKLTLKFLGTQANQKVFTLLKDQWAKGGVTVDFVTAQDSADMVARMNKGDYQVSATGWTTVTANPDYAVYSLFHSKGDYNRIGYNNPKIDELLDKGRTLKVGSAEFTANYKEFENILTNVDNVIVPMYFSNKNHAYNKNISGLEINLAKFARFEHAKWN